MRLSNPLLAVTSLAFAALMGMSATAAAQEREAVTVVLPSNSGAPADLPGLYYSTLRAQVEFHPEYDLNDVPEQSLDDLLLAIGCSVLDAECAELLGEVLGSELLLAGGLWSEGGTTSVRLELIDLSNGATLWARSHAFGDDGTIIRDNAALFARSILYPNEGSLSVATNPPGATVYLNDVESGTTPAVIEDLPLGLYAVRVDLDGHVTRTETATVDRGAAEVSLRLTADRAAPSRERAEPTPRAERSGDGSALRIAGLGTAGAGVAILAGGIVAGVSMRSTQNDFDSLVAMPLFDRAEAERLEDRGNSQAGTATALLATGGVLVAAGAAVAIIGFSRNGEEAPASVSVGPGSVRVRLRW